MRISSRPGSGCPCCRGRPSPRTPIPSLRPPTPVPALFGRRSSTPTATRARTPSRSTSWARGADHRAATALPSITEALTINGYTQPGASANTQLAGPGHQRGHPDRDRRHEHRRLRHRAHRHRGRDRSRPRHQPLPQRRHPNRRGGNGSVIAGNFLGTDPTGSSRPGSQFYGVDIEGASGVVVGGVNPADRNLLVGQRRGADLHRRFRRHEHRRQGQPDRHQRGRNRGDCPPVRGVRQHLRPHRRRRRGRRADGRRAQRHLGQHGGLGVGVGYTVGGTAAQATIEGNFIGTDVTGTLPLGNDYGVFDPEPELRRQGQRHRREHEYGRSSAKADPARSSRATSSAPTSRRRSISATPAEPWRRGSNWTIGGPAPGEGNVIANNGSPYGGIVNGGPTALASAATASSGTEPLGIDLYAGGSGGVTPNDAGDADTGPNGLQNYPILTSAGPALGEGAGTHIVGVLNSTASTTFDIDFYSNPSCASRPQEYLAGTGLPRLDPGDDRRLGQRHDRRHAAGDRRQRVADHGDGDGPRGQHLGVLAAADLLDEPGVGPSGRRHQRHDRRHALRERRHGRDRRPARDQRQRRGTDADQRDGSGPSRRDRSTTSS